MLASAPMSALFLSVSAAVSLLLLAQLGSFLVFCSPTRAPSTTTRAHARTLRAAVKRSESSRPQTSPARLLLGAFATAISRFVGKSLTGQKRKRSPIAVQEEVGDKSTVTPIAADDTTRTFMRFVADSRLHELQGRQGVLVLGLMGAGKSTAIAVQQGAIYEAKEEGGLELLKSDVWTPCVADGFQSQTFNIGVFEDPGTNTVYFDSAGLNEHRGQRELKWTQFSRAMALTLLKEISSTLVVVDVATFLTERGEGARNLAQYLDELVGKGESSEHFYQSMSFLITSPSGVQVTKEQFMASVKRMQKSVDKQMRKALRRLPKLTPLHGVNDLVSEIHGTGFGILGMEDPGQVDLGLLMKGVDWDQVARDDPDSMDLDRLYSTYRLLSTIEKDRLVMGNPVSERHCREQRRAVNEMIRKAQPVTGERLREASKSRVSNSLEVVNILSDVASSFTSEVRELRDVLKKIIDRSKKLHFTEIDRDWKGVRSNMLVEIAAQMETQRKEQAQLVSEAFALQQSTERLPLKTVEIREDAPHGFWGSLLWCFGKQYAQKTYRERAARFKDYQIVEHSPLKKVSEFANPRSGEISVTLRSLNGFDLRADVILRREERDLPVTAERLEKLQGRKQSCEEELLRLVQQQERLKAVGSADELLEMLLDLDNKLKAELQAVQRKVRQLVPELLDEERLQQPKTRGHTINKLYRLLAALEKAHALPQGLSQGTKSSIQEFVASSRECLRALDSARKTHVLERFLQDEMLDLDIEGEEERPEARPPAKPTLRRFVQKTKRRLFDLVMFGIGTTISRTFWLSAFSACT